ncbi:uncharacterized protein LODBEIA_P07200 [Lodderomyces beijingensis]|uniref:PH domain-containing protein n=1 Tax=Lodderomyces beijingensis TaxID=1775926 RepID=A0ABP0ZI62_9ASCO
MTESPQLNASLIRLKLLDALRSGDDSRIDAIIRELNSSKANIHNQGLLQLKETVLHYAVQVASLHTIQWLVQHADTYGLDINCQDHQGNTPLHLAAMAGRSDVVRYLLSLPHINDTIANVDKKQPVEVAKNLNIAQLMQFERAKFVEKAACDLRSFFSNRDFDKLEQLLVLNPRASDLLDINGADPETGNTVLHEFIQKDDVPMCEWILKHGGDPFKRDKRGKLPIDLVNPKDEPLKKLIKAVSKDQTIMDPVAATNAPGKTGNAPTYKGYLRKWTNFASGYKLRYFVVDENGILSYYTDQDDTNNSCRGSLNLGYATLHLDSSEKMKFEIYGKNGLRWHLKANHPIETNRWVWTLQNAITYAKDNIKRRRQLASGAGAGVGNASGANAGGVAPPTSANKTAYGDEPHEQVSTAESEPAEKAKHHRLRIPGRKKHKHKRDISQTSASGDEISNSNLSRSSTVKSNATSSDGPKIAALSPANVYPGASKHTAEEEHEYLDTDNENFDYDADEMEVDDYDSENEASIDTNHLNDEIAATKRSLQIEISSLLELFSQVMTSNTFEPNSKQAEVCIVGNNTIKAVSDMLGKYNAGIEARDGKLKRNLDRQLEVNQLWEKSIRQLENEIQTREDKLAVYKGQRKQLKKYFSGGNNAAVRSSGTVSPLPTTKVDQDNITSAHTGRGMSEVPEETQVDQVDKKLDAIQGHYAHSHPHLGNEDEQNAGAAAGAAAGAGAGAVPEDVIELLGDDSDDEFFDADEFEETQAPEWPSELTGEEQPPAPANGPASEPVPEPVPVDEKEQLPANESAPEPAPVNKEAKTGGLESSAQGAPAEQEVKDEPSHVPEAAAGAAGGAGTGHQNVQEQSVAPDEVPAQEEPTQKQFQQDSAPGDEGLNPAQRKVNQELQQQGTFLGYEKPPRSKLSMDEDNRPKVGLWGILKSMIGKDMTRMTLPVSFNEPTSLLQRLAEDIEYNDLINTAARYDDSTLRLIYIATFAATEYSSTIDRIAKPFNPLLGETFEYARTDQNYRLFVEQVSHHPPISACHATSPKWDYYGENAVDSKFSGRSFDFKHLGKMFCVVRPDNGVKDQRGNIVAEELYSWKKVNTAVVGIMIGNPTVDNYGKMIVTNHTTGDTITVDMKQRGWRASSAYQLSGQALDRNGVPQWAMGGHWNSRIYAKKVTGEQQSGTANRKMSILEDPDKTAPKSSDPFSGSKFLVWQVAPRPKVPFNLTAFAVTLNGLDENLDKWVAPTDTRLRPDQRDMEEGRYDQAADEKHRLEVKQRQARKRRDESGETYIPKWFIKQKHPVTGDMYWDYNGKYWPDRKAHQWQGCPDIF